ncbi:fatty acyl-AMP ligase [Streptomyces sp. NPDC046215]|uniref:AMP-dependent synthetase/ligase domain-containing protein n=1 Tax=Streptomyces stramineus TaxID=173861 RepID=A0ABN0ZYN2_9ACTN
MSIGSMPRPVAAGLDALVRDRAQRTPQALAFRYVADSRDPDAPGNTLAVTCSALDTRASAVAAALRERARPGDRVLLLHPHGPEYVASFLACLYAGVVAVPANPPDSPAGAARVAAIVRDARPALFATTAEYLGGYRGTVRRPDGAAVPGLATDTVDDAAAGGAPARSATAGTTAFLQYTSGSTGDPRGVVVTHDNLLANMAAMRDRFRLVPGDRQVSWLPPYHDMGLILGILLPLCSGVDAVLSSPFEFMVDPLSWLENLSRFGGTFSAAPNFAYDLCVRKSTGERVAALDLSAWRVAVNGAEPVRRATIDRFGKRFAPAGFAAERLTPAYGLAEATLMVSGPDPGTGARTTPLPDRAGPRPGEVVGVGRAVAATGVRIVAPDTLRTRPDGTEGEIWVRGPGVASGYWARPEATAATFGARPTDAPGTGPYLRTGDLGLLRDGELYVTGRIKDLLIVHGRNHYPQDVEEAVWNADPRLRPGCAAAFDTGPAEGDGPRLVAVAEYDGPPEGAAEAGAAALRAVTRDCGLRLSELVLLRRRTVPKTSAGKIRRSAAREAYLRGGLDEIARVTVPGPRGSLG